MPNVIVLTKAQADAVRGKSGPSSIEPVALTDGTFFVGPEVLADPAHAARVAAVGIDKIVSVDITTLDAVRIDAIFNAAIAQGKTQAQALAALPVISTAAK